jgi:hypothetical protein
MLMLMLAFKGYLVWSQFYHANCGGATTVAAKSIASECGENCEGQCGGYQTQCLNQTLSN